MKCERCEGFMREEDLIVSGGPTKAKGIAAWHCLDCGRIDYRSTMTHCLILEDAESPQPDVSNRASPTRAFTSDPLLTSSQLPFIAQKK